MITPRRTPPRLVRVTVIMAIRRAHFRMFVAKHRHFHFLASLTWTRELLRRPRDCNRIATLRSISRKWPYRWLCMQGLRHGVTAVIPRSHLHVKLSGKSHVSLRQIFAKYGM